MMSNERSFPNWILYLFAASIVGGILYVVFMNCFLGCTAAESYRESTKMYAVQAPVEIVPARTEAAIKNGENTYKTICAACHGQNMEGIIGPSLSDKEWWHASTEVELAKLVMKGISMSEAKSPSPNKVAMPAKGGASITNEQVWEVIYYLSSKNESITKNAVPTAP
jgi:cytochrome c oxidase cbb3-type subunit III